ncbi:MAG: hypothetical protein FJ284_00530 [Planctomycetes bacterium]|nr:hypothetical protein [Planctomycetota bacterium]MBM4057744.1 hypothetical protein [Planctomycetota bacterium]
MPMIAALVVPLAAGLDWLEGLLPLAFLVIWIVSQVRNLFRAAGKPPAVRPPPRPPRDNEAADDLNREIEVFLRRKLAEQAKASPVAAAPAKAARRRSRRSPADGPPPVPRPVRPDAAGGQGVATHVATAFAHDLAHEVPDDTIGAGGAASVPSVAAELATTLRCPGGLRQLILMQEVLTRPTHRW